MEIEKLGMRPSSYPLWLPSTAPGIAKRTSISWRQYCGLSRAHWYSALFCVRQLFVFWMASLLRIGIYFHFRNALAIHRPLHGPWTPSSIKFRSRIQGDQAVCFRPKPNVYRPACRSATVSVYTAKLSCVEVNANVFLIFKCSNFLNMSNCQTCQIFNIYPFEMQIMILSIK